MTDLDSPMVQAGVRLIRAGYSWREVEEVLWSPYIRMDDLAEIIEAAYRIAADRE